MSILKFIKESIDAKIELEKALTQLDILKVDISFFDVNRFRNKYVELPFEYPGDVVYYKMIRDLAAKGYNNQQILDISNYIVDREIQLKRLHYAQDRSYREQFY